MKTIDDLYNLIPELIDMVLDDPTIGDCDGTDGGNHVCYEKDGWCIEIGYTCSGEWDCDYGDYWTPPSYDLISAQGEVDEILVSYYDEATGETIDFADDDIDFLWNEISDALSSL